MQKINFQDLPSTTTPLNASNMNTLQTNVENAISNATLFEQLFNIPSVDHALGTATDLDDLYTETGIKFYSIWGNKPKKMPLTAYSYGTLIIITNSLQSMFLNIQIYITDKPNTASSSVVDKGVYIRTGKETSWVRLYGDNWGIVT